MVKSITDINAVVLQRELEWLEKIILTRLNIFFGQESDFTSVLEVVPPVHPEHEAAYVKFIHLYKMEIPERIILALAMAPHIQPEVLDSFFFKNNQYDRGFTEFGGLKGVSHGGFLPTGE